MWTDTQKILPSKFGMMAMTGHLERKLQIHRRRVVRLFAVEMRLDTVKARLKALRRATFMPI
jgi:hypothetical protein